MTQESGSIIQYIITRSLISIFTIYQPFSVLRTYIFLAFCTRMYNQLIASRTPVLHISIIEAVPIEGLTLLEQKHQEHPN